MRVMRRLAALAMVAGFALCMLLAVPTPVFAAEAPPEVGADAYVVMDAATGQVLVSKNASALRYPASITKIMTLGLTLERQSLEEAANCQAVVSDAAVDALIPRASMIALGRGEVAAVDDLLYATMIESANDAANVLAEYVGGSMEGFAGMMNAKVQALGLGGSHFANPSGQPDENHYITAYDMAEITRWALGVPGFRQVFGSTEYTMRGTNVRPEGRTFRNTNMIMQPDSGFYCEGVVGSKTGYIDDSRYTLVTVAERGGVELICVVLKCEFNNEKYNSTNALLDYCFDNFRRVEFAGEGLGAASVPVYGGGEAALGEIEVSAGEGASYLLHRSLSTDVVSVRAEVPERYVIGQPFEPVVYLSIDEDYPVQQSAQLAALPMTWTGLDKILAENTESGWERMAEEQPVLLGLLLAVPLLAAALIIGRIGYVKYRRGKRRKQKLAAARAHLPVRVAERPEPPERARRPVPMQTAVGQSPRANAVRLRVAYGEGGRPAAHAPRRTGQARSGR